MKIQPEEVVTLEEQPCVIDGSPGVQVRCYCTCGKLVRIDKFDEHVWDEYMRDHYIPILDQYCRHCGRKLVFKKALYKQIEREKTVEAEAEVPERPRYLPVRSCPKCDGDTSVIETRENGDGTIRRRRVCLSCGHRFSTMEIFYNYKNKSTSEV